MLTKILQKIFEVAHAIQSSRKTHGVSRLKSLVLIIYARFRYGIGPKSFSLFSLIEVPVSEWPNFSSDTVIESLLLVVNPRAERKIVSNKLNFYEHCLQQDLPIVPILYVNDSFSHAGRAVRIGSIAAAVKACKGPYFVKSLGGAHGKNAFSLEGGNDRWSYRGGVGSLTDLSEYCDSIFGGDGGWVLQPKIVSHRDLHQISSDKALSTLRVVTCLVESKAHILYAVLKIANGKAAVDNFAGGENGNMLAPINVESGVLGPARGSARQDWPEIGKIFVHPATGVRIEGMVVPFWEEVRLLMARAQESLPQLPSLGWDVAVTDDGPLIIEANSNYSGDLLQIAFGRGMKAELPKVLCTVVSARNRGSV